MRDELVDDIFGPPPARALPPSPPNTPAASDASSISEISNSSAAPTFIHFQTIMKKVIIHLFNKVEKLIILTWQYNLY